MTIIILNVVCNDTIPIYSIFGLNYLQSSDILPIFAARNMNVMNWYEQLPTLCPPLDVLYDVSQAKFRIFVAKKITNKNKDNEKSTDFNGNGLCHDECDGTAETGYSP